MVGFASLLMMGVTCLICFIVPIVCIWWLRHKYNASIISFLVGMIAFILSVQALEAPIHIYFLKMNETTATWLSNPYLYSLYGGLMAGIFEETARWICFKFFLKKHHRIQDSLSYGVGHGGIEAMLIVGTTYLSNLMVSIMINNGTIDSLGFSVELQELVTQQLSLTSPLLFGIAGYEWLMTLIIQVGLSVLVFKGVREHQIRYYFIAILLHAILDFPAALYQMGISNIFVIEGIITLFAIGYGWFILKQMKQYRADLTKNKGQELEKYQKTGC